MKKLPEIFIITVILYSSEVQSRFRSDKIKGDYDLFEGTSIEDFFNDKDSDKEQPFDVTTTEVSNYKLNKVNNVNRNCKSIVTKSTFLEEGDHKNGKTNIKVTERLIFPLKINDKKDIYNSIYSLGPMGLSTSYSNSLRKIWLQQLFKRKDSLRKSDTPRFVSRASRSPQTHTCNGTEFRGNFIERVKQMTSCMWNSRKELSNCSHWSVNYG